MSKQIVLADHELVVLHAATVGFFYNYGKRQNVCKHTSCGWRNPSDRECGFMALLEPNSDSWYKSYNKKEISIHKKKGCKTDWCIKREGSRPDGWPIPKPNFCKKTYFRAYTDKEMSNPNTKVELIAIALSVAEQNRAPRNNIICVYDLMNDKWHNDKWWKFTPKGDLSPWDDWGLDYAPKAIHGIDEILIKAKAGI
jgi:hypothetical protein